MPLMDDRERRSAHLEARRLTGAMRVVLVAFLVLAGLAFILLYLRSGHTDREFAWTIRPEIMAAFLGAGYGAGCVLVAASLPRRPWSQLRIGIGIVLVFTAMILIMTLLHLDRFHFGAPSGGLARFAAWVFLAVYLFTPTVGTWLYVREQRRAGPPAAGGPSLSGWLRAAIAGQGGLMVGFGAALYVAPGLVAPAWPWTLTTLTAQAVGSWLVPIGLGNLAVLREGDLRRARVLGITSVAYGVLQLGAIAGYPDQVRWHAVAAWVWLAVLITAIVTGGHVVWATTERRRDDREPSLAG
jgi:hypothetical protein